MYPSELHRVLRPHAGWVRPFPYFESRYAIELLRWFVGAGGRSVREVRASQFASLLAKPLLADALRARGSGWIDAAWLDALARRRCERYRLTLGQWGDYWDGDRAWHQTSRCGKNVVLQVNFPEVHDRAYEKFLQPGEYHPFESDSHPVHGGGLRTLAWARLDLDLDAGEALIEEVQSDWVRDARYDYVQTCRDSEHGMTETDRRFALYYERVLAPHAAVWEELTLFAAIAFLRGQLGIRRVFHHTFAGGNALKGLSECCGPPRSLYEQLPRRFCFRRTATAPRFLRDEWRRVERPPRWSRRAPAKPDRSRDGVRFWLLELH